MKTTEPHRQAAAAVLADFGLVEIQRRAGQPYAPTTSLPIVAQSPDGRTFLLKYYLPPRDDAVLPTGLRPDDFAWRETGFYRVLDTLDPKRRELPAPHTVAIGPGQPPRWILLEHIEPAPGPHDEVLAQDDVFDLLDRLAAMPTGHLLGRRGFPVDHWDPVSYLDRVRGMYDTVLFVVGESRWRKVQSFFAEALRWTDGRPRITVHGDFREENLLVDADGRVHLLDFENIGIGSQDHDLAWFWLHSSRRPEWKRQLVRRWLDRHVGGDRIRTEWGVRAATSYLALRRLRWSYLTQGDEDERTSQNLAMLDAALMGDLFPLA
jgi:aminoglycoside phosphotransferase (APT) family kinase protein